MVIIYYISPGLNRRSSPPMVSIAEDHSGSTNGGSGGGSGCQHYKRKCKFYVSIAPLRRL